MARIDTPLLPGFGEGEINPHPPPLVRRAFDLYNEFARRNKWVVTTVLDPGRQGQLRRAMPYYGGVDGFHAALEKCSKSDFLMGRVAGRDGRKTFKLDLDFLLAPKTMRRVIDGFYNGEGDVVPTKTGQTVAKGAVNWRAQLEKYRKGRWWPGSFGPRPEEPGPHLAPAEMIEEWRKKNGVTGAARPSETREERLAAMVVSFRRHGHYDRANKCEEELAQLEKRPPVLVPAPEVALLGMPEKEPVVRPPPYTPPRRRSEADVTREMALSEAGDYRVVPEGDVDYGDDYEP